VSSDERPGHAPPRNPLRVVATGLAWRSVGYCVTSVLVGVVSLIAGVVGFVVLPRVARRTARTERSRISILRLPRLVEADATDATRDGWTSAAGANIAVWGTTALFGLVDAIVGGIVGAALTVLVVSLVDNVLAARASGIVFALVMTWIALVVGLYAAWGLAWAQARIVQRILASQSELSARVAELQTSRSELVDVFETERGRIERDLHDGAQQHLVVSTLRLGEATYYLDEGQPDGARTAIADAQRSIEDALVALRDTIRGLHPQVLTERGLVAAVRELAARQPQPVTFAVEGDVRPVPQTIENAAYHVVSEALTNVAKHACAGSAQVVLAFADGLTVTVNDDGLGGATSVAGHGLSGLAERMDAVGGTLEITSPAGGPTSVVARFPRAG